MGLLALGNPGRQHHHLVEHPGEIMKVARIVAAVFGGLFALAAIGMLVGGGFLTWAHTTQRDADGFLTSPSYDLDTEGYAVVSEDIDIASRPGDWFPTGIADVRFTVRPQPTESIFVGIGPAVDVEAYLGDVERDEVVRLGPDSSDVRTRTIEGSRPFGMAPPASQDFWVASSQGTGSQSITWEVDRGEWSVVVMNSEGSAGIDFVTSAGVRIDALLGIAIGILIGGLIFGGLGAALMVWGTRAGAPREETEVAAVAPTAGPYPVAVTGFIDPNLSRWLWLVKWLLAIPHYIVLAFLWAAVAVLWLVSLFAIAFTGRYPRGIFDFNVGVMRWTWRVSYYAFGAAATDQYPPFTLRSDVGYPTSLEVEYPERLSRGLVWVKWWLLAIPHYLIVGLFTSGLVWWATEIDGDRALEIGGGLIGILVLVAVIVLGFTGRYPQGLFDLVMGLNRWSMRVGAYVLLMTDEYPPFRLDMGGSEPPVPAQGSPGAPPGDRELAKSIH
jgi:hypothetical protein